MAGTASGGAAGSASGGASGNAGASGSGGASGNSGASGSGGGSGGGCVTAAGYVKPDPGTCVGVPSGVTLTDYKPGMKDTDVHVIDVAGSVLENKRILGCVVVKAPNVTIRNNDIECFASRDINQNMSPYPGHNGPIVVEGGSTGALIEHNNLRCKKKSVDQAACDFGIFLLDATARYNDLSGMVDGFDPRSNATIEYNYLHDQGTAYEEWLNDYSHADGVQLYTFAGNVTIRGNYFQGLPTPPTHDREKGLQAVLIQAASGAGPKPDIKIQNNMVAGYWPSLRLSCINGAACLIEENTIDAIYKSSSWVIDLRQTHSSTVARCNRFTDGSLVQTSNTNEGTSITSGC